MSKTIRISIDAILISLLIVNTVATKNLRISENRIIAVADHVVSFDLPMQILNMTKFHLPNNPIIIDAGAFDGKESIELAKFWPHGKIHSFEPIPQVYQTLLTATQEQKNIKTYPIALSDKSGKAQMHVSEWPDKPGVCSASSSLLAPKDHLKYSHIPFPKTITVPIITLDEWAEKNGVDHVDFLWLDMQGYELNMMKASPKILKTVKAIVTEIEFVEAYTGQYLYWDIKKWLEQEGFEMIAINTSPLWFGDALFVRKH